MSAAESRYLDVDGIRTHYLEAGSGPNVVLLHSGEFGACAELSWEFAIDALAEHFRIIAPDWLGFGKTDKIFDFVDARGRRVRHMQRFLEILGITEADFIGNSMAGGMIARAAIADPPQFPLRRIVLVSGGGFAPDNEHRRALLDYDGTFESMQRVLHAMFHNPSFAADATYVQRRVDISLLPGAWECTAAARFRSPVHPTRAEFGQPDTTPYERIRVPTLIVAGANDKLRLPGYANELALRIPDAEALVIEECAHCPNIEYPALFTTAVIDFLRNDRN